MDDRKMIYLDDAIDAVAEGLKRTFVEYRDVAEKMLNKVPSAQPETKPISYLDCANAMLMMWMDEVVTDGEYNRIMDKLNAHELKKRSKNG